MDIDIRDLGNPREKSDQARIEELENYIRDLRRETEVALTALENRIKELEKK